MDIVGWSLTKSDVNTTNFFSHEFSMKCQIGHEFPHEMHFRKLSLRHEKFMKILKS